MDDRDKTYLLKELTKTIDGSDSTAAFCLCQRWILKDALVMLKEQESVIEALKSDLDETLKVLGEQPEIVRCRDCQFHDVRCVLHNVYTNADNFCSWAVKRDG